MPKLGMEVDQYFNSMGKSLSTKSIIYLGMEVLKILEKVHSSGYVYGDLKLDNILIGEGQQLPDQKLTYDRNVFEKVTLHLIDFGFAQRYIDKVSGRHIE